MLNLLIPCAGSGQRFKDVGFTSPKPLIDIEGEPMVVRAIESIVREKKRARLILIIQESDAEGFHSIKERYQRDVGSFYMIKIPTVTNGAACTCLLASGIINSNDPLLIASCDQIIEGNIWPLLCQNADGALLTMRGDDSPKWSYTRIERGFVTHVREKSVISDRANCGVYWFAKGKDFVTAARKMIEANDHTNDEFYVAPVYNYMIVDKKIVVEVKCEDYNIKFHGVGTPEDLGEYLGRKK